MSVSVVVAGLDFRLDPRRRSEPRREGCRTLYSPGRDGGDQSRDYRLTNRRASSVDDDDDDGAVKKLNRGTE